MSPAGGAILLYHSIADAPRDPYGSIVSPANFRAQMEVVATRYSPVALEQVLDEQAELPDRAVAVTFDDGYVDNLECAAPILADLGIPATIFVASGFIGAERPFWWDEIDELLAGTDRPVPQVRVDGFGGPSLGGPDVLLQLRTWLQGVDRPVIEEVLAQLRVWAGSPAAAPSRSARRPLTIEELRDLATRPGIEIGAHTRHHLRLGAHSAERQRDDIAGSVADLRGWLGTAPRTFAYPFGNPRTDYSRESVAVVRELGLAGAVCSLPGLARVGSARWELPRYFVANIGARPFEGWLDTRFRSVAVRGARRLLRDARRGLGRGG